MIKRYRQAFQKIAVALDRRQIEKLIIYCDMLKKANQKMNLTAVDDDDGILYRHFVDSCQVLRYRTIAAKQRVVDIGSGAGFPGLPIAIASGAEVDLIDSLNKRVLFLNEVIERLQLATVQAFHQRVESAGQGAKRAQYDFVLSRAVTKLAVLAEYGLPLLKIGGEMIVHKALPIEEELIGSKQALAILGGDVSEVVYYRDFYEAERCLVIVKKRLQTPDKYPRRIGVPSKKPL